MPKLCPLCFHEWTLTLHCARKRRNSVVGNYKHHDYWNIESPDCHVSVRDEPLLYLGTRQAISAAHYAQKVPIMPALCSKSTIMPALCSMLFGTYYSQNYANIIRPTQLLLHRKSFNRECLERDPWSSLFVTAVSIYNQWAISQSPLGNFHSASPGA